MASTRGMVLLRNKVETLNPPLAVHCYIPSMHPSELLSRATPVKYDSLDMEQIALEKPVSHSFSSQMFEPFRGYEIRTVH